MARFDCSGLDDFALSLQEIEEIPDDVKDEMLSAGADVAVSGLKKTVSKYGLVDTGELRDSIQKFRRRSKGGELYYLVYPYGTRKKAKIKKLGRERAYGSNGVKRYKPVKRKMSNNDVGFVHEFGAPYRGIPARPWMSTTVEASADEIAAAEFDVYDKWLKSEDL